MLERGSAWSEFEPGAEASKPTHGLLSQEPWPELLLWMDAQLKHCDDQKSVIS